MSRVLSTTAFSRLVRSTLTFCSLKISHACNIRLPQQLLARHMPARDHGQSLSIFKRQLQKRKNYMSASLNIRQLLPSLSTRSLSTLDHQPEGENGTDSNIRPRWQAPPPAMTAPFRSKRPVPHNEFQVNEDPAALDRAYARMLGAGGEKMLTEEVKWLAVTHKSFDHGRRGYNDRLVFFGKRIVHLQTSLALINSSINIPTKPSQERTPFRHPSLEGLQGLNSRSKEVIEENGPLCQLAQKYGLQHVIRWKPRIATNLWFSGAEQVYARAIYAIIGAIALEKGGEVANTITRDRVLSPLGVKT